MARASVLAAVAAIVTIAAASLSGTGTSKANPMALAATPASGEFAGQIDIGGGRMLYLRCSGSGSPTVLLESGIHDSSDTWNLAETEPPVLASPAVFPGVAGFTHVCEYDRPGTIRYTDPPALTTRSTPLSAPRSLTSMVNDLHTLLTTAGVPGPYLLVAHSYGGLIVRLFAQTYPSEAAGLVLVDAFGIDIKPLFGDDWTGYEMLLNQPGTPLDEQPGFETVDADGAIQSVEQAPALPFIPLAVISKTEPIATAPTVSEVIHSKLEQVWPQVQNTLVALEPQTPHVLATGSDHYVQIRDPDLTISVIKLVFDRARQSR